MCVLLEATKLTYTSPPTMELLQALFTLITLEAPLERNGTKNARTSTTPSLFSVFSPMIWKKKKKKKEEKSKKEKKKTKN